MLEQKNLLKQSVNIRGLWVFGKKNEKVNKKMFV